MKGAKLFGRGGRVALAVGLAASTMVVFAALAGVGLAGSSLSASQYEYGGDQYGGDSQYGKKVAICHKNKKTIRVSVNAWPAHKAHGDAVGTCAQARAKKAKATKLAKAAKEKGKSAAAKAKKT